MTIATSTPSWVRPRGTGGKFLPKDPNNVKRKKKKEAPPAVEVHVHLPPPSPTPPPTPQNPAPVLGLKNKIAFVVDRSGSMGGFRHDVPRVFNDLVRGIREKSQETGIETTVSFMSFDNNYGSSDLNYHYFEHPVGSARELQPGEYQPRGGTPLRDAIGDMVERLRKLEGAKDEKTSFLLYVLTDGEENQSKNWSEFALRELLQEVQKTDRWTVAVMCPRGYTGTVERMLGIPRGNIQEWEQTSRGFETASSITRSAVGSFYGARSSGQTRSTAFFASVADPVQVQRQLQDVTGQYRHWEVKSGDPAVIADFIRGKGLTFELGRAFYQLVKQERIQARKEIALRDKITGKVYAGPEARQLLGLPAGLGVGEIKVKPGDHRNYDVFVQSTSTNRILGRGSQVLYKIS